MMTMKEFAEALSKTLKGELSASEFSRQAMEYLKSPDYNRWKAVQGAEDLKRWKEGRAYLMELIEAEKKAGTTIDYETVPLNDGHDSIKVIVNGKPTVCFPSFCGKESIDMNWTHVMEAKKNKPCGRFDCKVSTSIDDVTLTFGRGDLDFNGFWEIPCVICAEAFKKHSPKQLVWPVKAKDRF